MKILGDDIIIDYSSDNIPPQTVLNKNPSGRIIPWVRIQKTWYQFTGDILEFFDGLEIIETPADLKTYVLPFISEISKSTWVFPLDRRGLQIILVDSKTMPIYNGDRYILDEENMTYWDAENYPYCNASLLNLLPRMKWGDKPKKIIFKQSFEIE